MADKIRRKLKAQKRNDPNRSIKKRILIICEGEKTEPSYFRKLRSKLELNPLLIVIDNKNRGYSPISLVIYGENILKTDDDYDDVFFVFDRDSHPTYDKAIEKINGLSTTELTMNAITSVPCFELWLLLHFKKSTSPYDREGGKSAADCAIADLKKHLLNYEKSNSNYFDELEKNLETAIKNSEHLIVEGLKAEPRKHHSKHHINPSTLVHKLVKVLLDYNNKT